MSDKVEVGPPYLTRYERARIVGARALQISYGAPVLMQMENISLPPIKLATEELNARVLPIGIRRQFNNGRFQIVPIQWLKDGQYVAQIDPQEELVKFKK